MKSVFLPFLRPVHTLPVSPAPIHGKAPVTSDESFFSREYASQRERLIRAGLDEETLRQMAPADRVAALERAQLNPYDYIYLAC